jgi:hypothetical protein
MDPQIDPRQAMLEMIRTARADFHRAIDEILQDAQQLANSLGAAIGEVSPHQALTAWKREMAKRLTYDHEPHMPNIGSTQ